MQDWKLENAHQTFEQIIEKVLNHQPQTIVKNNQPIAVILSYTDYRKLLTQQSLSSFFQQSPLAEIEVDLTRDQSMDRPEINFD